MNEYPQEFLDLLESVTAKRPRTVIQHILKNGHVTSQELKDVYGYNHPPRAVRDVREYGIPLVTYRIQGDDGRIFTGNEIEDYNKLIALSGERTAQETIKRILHEHL